MIYSETLAAVKTAEAVITPAAGKCVSIRKIHLNNPAASGSDASVDIAGDSTVAFEGFTNGRTPTTLKGAVDEPVLLSGPVGLVVEIEYEEV